MRRLATKGAPSYPLKLTIVRLPVYLSSLSREENDGWVTILDGEKGYLE